MYAQTPSTLIERSFLYTTPPYLSFHYPIMLFDAGLFTSSNEFMGWHQKSALSRLEPRTSRRFARVRGIATAGRWAESTAVQRADCRKFEMHGSRLAGQRMQIPRREVIAPHRTAIEWHQGMYFGGEGGPHPCRKLHRHLRPPPSNSRQGRLRSALPLRGGALVLPSSSGHFYSFCTKPLPRHYLPGGFLAV
jgi:hypothetical protein